MRAQPNGAAKSGGQPASQPFPAASTVPLAQLKGQLGGQDYNASEAATGRQLTSQLLCLIISRPISLVLVAF